MGNFNIKALFDFRLVQNRVMRAGCRCRIVFAFYRADAAGQFGLLHNLAREVVPRTDAFVGKMENFLFAGAYLRQSGDNRFRQVIGVGGGADLVKDDVQAFPFGTELARGANRARRFE